MRKLMTSKIYFDSNSVKTWAIDDLKDFEGHKWKLYESTSLHGLHGQTIWCMEWYEESDV